MVRDVLDLAPHPQLAAAGEGRVQCVLDLLVEAADGEDPAAPAGLGVAEAGPGAAAAGCSEAGRGGASGSKS